MLKRIFGTQAIVFFSIIFFQFKFSISSHSIVLVHIGNAIPVYLEDCLKQIRFFNSCDLYLISNAVSLQSFQEVLEKFNVVPVACETLIKSRYHEKFLKNGRLENGFWRFTTERFFYLEALVEEYDLHDVFHMEYDNMLYVDLSELLPIFNAHYSHAAATFDNDERCIPGFVYFADHRSLNTLVKFLSRLDLKDKNDMETLSLFRHHCKMGKYIDSLPILPSSYCDSHELITPTGKKVKKDSTYYKNIEYFNSIFDAAAIGQYLGGIDPRNGPITQGFVNESCVFNPAYFVYEWEEDDSGRKVPYACFKDSRFRVNNLHIHSKNLKKFLSQ